MKCEAFVNTLLALTLGVYEALISKNKPMDVHLPLFEWKLEDYSPMIKIFIEEVDLKETYTRTETRMVEFATNFSIDPTEGFLEKVGLKFGASPTERQTRETQLTYTKESDFLGESIVNFGNDILIGDGTTVREFYMGYCKFNVMPLKVE